jgi:hypothetical protein
MKRREERNVEKIDVQTFPPTSRLQRPFLVVSADSSDAGYHPSKIAHSVSEWLAVGSS